MKHASKTDSIYGTTCRVNITRPCKAMKRITNKKYMVLRIKGNLLNCVPLGVEQLACFQKRLESLH